MGALEYLLTLPDVEVDVKDKKGGGTALYLAAKKGNRLGDIRLKFNLCLLKIVPKELAGETRSIPLNLATSALDTASVPSLTLVTCERPGTQRLLKGT